MGWNKREVVEMKLETKPINRTLQGLLIQLFILNTIIISTLLFSRWIFLINLYLAWLIWKNK